MTAVLYESDLLRAGRLLRELRSARDAAMREDAGISEIERLEAALEAWRVAEANGQTRELRALVGHA